MFAHKARGSRLRTSVRRAYNNAFHSVFARSEVETPQLADALLLLRFFESATFPQQEGCPYKQA